MVSNSLIDGLIVLNVIILFFSAYGATVGGSTYVWSLINLIVTFATGAVHLFFIGGMDVIACIYIVICSSGMGVLLL